MSHDKVTIVEEHSQFVIKCKEKDIGKGTIFIFYAENRDGEYIVGSSADLMKYADDRKEWKISHGSGEAKSYDEKFVQTAVINEAMAKLKELTK